MKGTIRSNRAALRLAITTAGVSVITACASMLDPSLPAGTRALIAPPVYEHWWAMTEACSGLTGSLAAIDFYVVPGVDHLDEQGRTIGGYWSRGSNRIVLAEGASMDGALVRHEMLHALLRGKNHPRRDYLERCGGVVVCIEACLRDAGPAPVPARTLARVTPDSLAVDVQIDPAQPGATAYDGHFTVTVTVHNPRPDSVVVRLPPPRDGGPSESFAFDAIGSEIGVWYANRAWDSEVTVFGPGETKRQVYDFTVKPQFDGERGLPTGSYQIGGAFGGSWAGYRTVVVGGE